jgi:hypothetical protein
MTGGRSYPSAKPAPRSLSNRRRSIVTWCIQAAQQSTSFSSSLVKLVEEVASIETAHSIEAHSNRPCALHRHYVGSTHSTRQGSEVRRQAFRSCDLGSSSSIGTSTDDLSDWPSTGPSSAISGEAKQSTFAPCLMPTETSTILEDKECVSTSFALELAADPRLPGPIH